MGSDEESCDENVLYNDPNVSYKGPCIRCEEGFKVEDKQKKTISQLQAEKEEFLVDISNHKDEVSQLTSRIENMTKYIRVLNNGSEVLDEIFKI